jgi:two-component system phosphate regulon sensor histidine kinase PhoR
MNWLGLTVRVLVVVSLCTLVGAMYGHAMEGALVALVAFVAYWIYQMQRVRRWLRNPDTPPPEIWGTWGELTSRIYAIQRNSRVTQERLQANVRYLKDSFTSMRDGVVMVDANGAIEWFNDAAQPLLGLRFPEDAGQTLTNLVRGPEFKRYFLDGDYNTPLQYLSGGETSRHLRVEITHFGEGERLLFVRDVSSEVRMEQIRRDFVANVSHELRTPLTVISGYLGTFIENSSELPDRYLRPLRQMSQQAERMESMLKDLLLLSRIENEKRSGKKEQVDVRGLLQELRDELCDAFPGRRIELELHSDVKVLGDYRELYSAVSNLVTNALKYSEAPAPVQVSWSFDGDKCLLKVRDHGVGIEASMIPRLTERFFRVDDSRNSSTGGTGLGLAIVKHVAQAHDARLQIESELGKGSCFTLEFPPGE